MSADSTVRQSLVIGRTAFGQHGVRLVVAAVRSVLAGVAPG
ncbi:hypothetical protein ACFC34_37610 [Streptomyces sp. NPDC056053]